MKRILIILSILIIPFATVSADELLESLKNASDQVARDLSTIAGNDDIYSGAIVFENRPVIMGDLFTDLLANRLLDNSSFQGNLIKGYSPGTYRIIDANWIFTGSVYKAGSSYFLSLYLKDSEGNQKKGWEFLVSGEGSVNLLEASRISIMTGGDIYEPNDSSSEAVELNPDPEVELTNIKIGGDSDEDWFYIEVEADSSESSMLLLKAYTTGDLDTYIELFAPSDLSYAVAENDDGDNGSNASISYSINESGRWYIKVRGYSSDTSGDYGLVVSAEERELGPGEPDNSAEEAAFLDINGSQLRREIDFSGDEDWYYVDVEGSSSDSSMLLLKAYTTGDLDTYIELYAPGDTSYPIAENDDGDNGSNASISYVINEPGRWYVKVRGYSSDVTGSYGVSASYDSREYGPGEPDNSMEEATILEIGDSQLRRTMDYSEDYDYFKITLEDSFDENQALIVQTYGNLDLTMTLLDSYDNEITTDDDSGDDGNPKVMISGEEPGDYYIVVYPYGGDNTGSYTIKAYYIEIEKDDYENDNNLESASSIEINSEAQTRTFMPANDEDWVKFVVDMPGRYIIETSGSLDTIMTLYDSSGDYIYDDDDSGSDSNAMISEDLDEGVYYIQVSPYDGDEATDVNYSLSVSRESGM